MGDYATVAQLKARYEDDTAVAHLTHDEEGGTPDVDVLNECIDAAEGEINSYIAMKYEVPYDTSADTKVANLLKGWTLDLAMVHLAKRQPPVPEALATSRDQVIEWLDKIAAGKAVLPATLTPDSTTTREPLIEIGGPGTSSSSDRIFTRDTQGAL